MNKTELKQNSLQNSYRVPALEKGLDVLELLSESAHPMSLTDISKQLKRTKQELFRIVSALHQRRYLVRDEAQRYRVSTLLFELGSKNHTTQALVARSMPHMEQLVDQIDEPCHLTIVVQNKMLVVARAECATDVSLSVRVGANFEIHNRNSGLAALAFMSKEEREQYWSNSGEKKRDIKRIEKELKQIYQNGYVLSDSPVSAGIVDCAVPITGSNQSLLGVICVSYLLRLNQPANRSEILEAAQICAKSISAEFGPFEENPSSIVPFEDILLLENQESSPEVSVKFPNNKSTTKV